MTVSAPQNFAVTNISSTTMQVSFSPPANGSGKYTNWLAYRDPTQSATFNNESSIGSALTFLVTGLTPGHSYYFSIRSSDNVAGDPGTALQPTTSYTTATTTAPSANNYAYTSATQTPLLHDINGVSYGLTGSGPGSYSVVVNGVTDTSFNTVQKLQYSNGRVYRQDSGLQWAYRVNSTDSWTGRIPAPNSEYTMNNGQIIGPTGAAFNLRGINMMDSDTTTVSTLQSQFPRLNFIRLACFSYPKNADGSINAAYYYPLIKQMTDAGIVVMLENHQNFYADGTSAGNRGGSSGAVFTGTILSNESAWYSALASAYRNNPLVWFATNNEPPYNPSVAALSDWQNATITAIRNTGNNCPIGVMMANPGTYGTPGGMTASDYSGFHNLFIDFHCYGWLWNDNGNADIGRGLPDYTGQYSTNTATIKSEMQYCVGQMQTLRMLDGLMPVIIGEYGRATDGQHNDANGSQNVSVVQAASGDFTSGCVAWLYTYIGSAFADNLLNSAGGTLSSDGTQLQTWMATAP